MRITKVYKIIRSITKLQHIISGCLKNFQTELNLLVYHAKFSRQPVKLGENIPFLRPFSSIEKIVEKNTAGRNLA